MAQEWVEQLAKRNRTSKTRRLYVDGQPTKKHSWDGQVGRSMHYLDADGLWQDVDDTAEEADGDGFTVKFTKLSYFGRIDNEGRRRFYPDKNDLSYWIEFKKPFANMGAPTRQNRWFYWDFAHAVIGVRFDVDSLKFGFRLKDSEAPTSITIPFETQGITRQGRHLRHKGEVVAVLRKPIATGSNLDEFGEPVQKECNVVFGPGTVTISLDPSGLEYPIDIDPTIDKEVTASGDDGESDADGGFGPSQSWMGIGIPGSVSHDNWSRFLAVTIPAASTIGANTYYSVWSYYAELNCETKVYAEDAANPAAPTSRANHVSKVRTAAGVTWDSIPDADDYTNSPSIASVIQELVNSYDYSSGAPIQILHDDDATEFGFTNFRTYDSAPSRPPKLHIEYSAAAPQILEPSAIGSLEAFGALKANFTMFPSAIGSAEAFGSHKANLKVAPSAIASLEDFGAHTIFYDQFIDPSAIASLETFGTAKLNLTVFPSAIATAEAFGAVKLNLVLGPNGIGSLEMFGSHQLNFTILPSAIASLEAFGTAALLMTQFLGPSAIASLEAFGTPTMVLILAPSGIASAEAFGVAQLDLRILAQAIASLEAFGTLVITVAVVVVPLGMLTARYRSFVLTAEERVF